MLTWKCAGVKTGRVTKAKKNNNINGGSPIKKEVFIDDDEYIFAGNMGDMTMDEEGGVEI